MFADDPKCFLVDSLADYRKPILFDKDGSVVDYSDLVHRGIYTLKFEKTKRVQFEKKLIDEEPYPLVESIAYSDNHHSFNTSKQRNAQVRTQVESAFTDYLYISKPEDFLYFNEVHNVAKCQHTFNV